MKEICRRIYELIKSEAASAGTLERQGHLRPSEYKIDLYGSPVFK